MLWTTTEDKAKCVPTATQRELQYTAKMAGISVWGFHLDRWWGLDRWERVLTDPFFRCTYVLTADGGHQDAFEAAGVNHLWSPPAIAPHNAYIGPYKLEYDYDIVFVGSWQGGYHPEWEHRRQLIKHLQRKWASHVEFFPQPSRPAVRGRDLADLYASAKVVVGDSCLVPKLDGTPMTHYVSDRVFETIGRGGYLLHPYVEGVIGLESELKDLGVPLYAGKHLGAWPLGDWDKLDAAVECALDCEQDRDRVRTAGHLHVKANHTYANRLDWILGLVGL